MSRILSREQVQLVDRLAGERYGITGLVLMENAGRNAAEIIRHVYGSTGTAAIFCGGGNNGGDGFVIGRHLHNRGWNIRVVATSELSKMTGDARMNFETIDAMEVDTCIARTYQEQMESVARIGSNDLVVDALLGTGFHGEVREPLAALISRLNSSRGLGLVSVDVPSGFDCDLGTPSNATVKADLTVTFVAAKPGFLVPGAETYVGRIAVADIGVPRELVDRVKANSA